MRNSDRAKRNTTKEISNQLEFFLKNLQKKKDRRKRFEIFRRLPGYKKMRRAQDAGIAKVEHDIKQIHKRIKKLQKEGKIFEILPVEDDSDTIQEGTGWIEDPDDERDFDAPEKLSVLNSTNDKVDTFKISTKHIIEKSKFTPIKNQGSLGACTAFSGCAQLEYYVKKRTKHDVDLSELFLYLETRRNLGWEKKDSGAYLRTTMKTMASIGTCLEKEWPYDKTKFTENPPAFVYPRADDYKADSYFKADKKGYPRQQVMSRIKSLLNRDMPLICGFNCYSSVLNQARTQGELPFPSRRDSKSGGHAVLLIGYDDNKVITNSDDGSKTTGTFVFRNSWGKNWGDGGYGYLPYEYLLKGQLRDIWCLVRADYLNESRFE